MSAASGSGQSVISPEERIQELNNLDMEIVKMLAAMGRAVEAMAVSEDKPMTLQQRRHVFQSSVKEAFERLATVDVGQRRSIYALAEAGIIDAAPDAQFSRKPAPSMLGNLDIGVLNSQNDKVGKEIEAEQWAKVRETLEKLKELSDQFDDGAPAQSAAIKNGA